MVAPSITPVENYNEWRMIYFISFLLLVGFFVLNMFVGVVVENFHRCREAQEKEERERRQAKINEKLQRKSNVAQQRPYWHSYSPRRRVIHSMMMNKYVDIVVTVVICLNIISMAVEHYNMPQEMVTALRILNYIFTFAFFLESILKLVALGFIRYIRDRWNLLDSAIVALSIVGVALEEIQSGAMPINPTIIRVMRILRVARVLKLVKTAKGIRALLDTVLVALPQIGNLGLLFFLLFYIFAALGVELFGRLPDCSTVYPCEGMGVHANFKNFGMAFLTLFRIATGDNWNGIMKLFTVHDNVQHQAVHPWAQESPYYFDALREDCVPEGEECLVNCCANRIITPIFFVVFVLTAQFVLVNVVVAVLMKQLEDSGVSVITCSSPNGRHAVVDRVVKKQCEEHLDKISLTKERATVTLCPDVKPPGETNETSGPTASSLINRDRAIESMEPVMERQQQHDQLPLQWLEDEGEQQQQHRRALTKQLSLPSDYTYRPQNR